MSSHVTASDYTKWRSFAPLQKSRRNYRFYVWTKALFGMVFVPAQELSGRVWSLNLPPETSFQGGKTFCASFCAPLIAGSRRAFLCVERWLCLFVAGPTLNSTRQTDVDTLMIRTQSRVRVRVRVRVIYLNQTAVPHQILGGVGVRVMHSRSDAPSSNPTHSILNCFFP